MKTIIVSLLLITSVFANLNSVDFESFFIKNNNIMLLIDPSNGEIVKANKSASNFYKYPIKKLESMNIKEINSFSKKQVQQEMQKAKSEKRNYFIFNHILSDQSIKKVRVFSSPIKYQNKKILYSTIYPILLEKEFLEQFNKTLEQQIQEQSQKIKQSEAFTTNLLTIGILVLISIVITLIYIILQKNRLSSELKIKNEQFSLAMDTTKDGLWDWEDTSSNKVTFNHNWKAMLGYKDDELENTFESWSDRVHDDDIQQALDDINKHIDKKTKVYENIHRMKHKNGHWIWIYDRGKALFDDDGKLYRMIGFHTDISKQKETEYLIKKQKEEFETIFNYALDGIAITDLEGNFLNCNHALLDMTGLTKKEILKENCTQLTAPEDREKNIKALQKAIKTGFVTNIEKDCIINDKHISVNMNVTLLPDKKRLLIILHDTTIINMMQEQSKLASMGEMIGNIAHQWRQPLNVISSSASGLEVKSEFDDVSNKDIKEFAQNIIKQTKYLSKTIDDFRDFIKGDIEYSQISIKETIEDSLSLIGATLENNYIKLSKNLKDDITIIGNKSELSQALINILNNAKDSIKESIENEDDRYIFISTEKKDENALELKIIDSGGGIPCEVIDKIFEPYFTTKHQSVGTGIGLSMAYKILRQRHKTSIDVFNDEFEYDNKKHIGACFSIIFKS